MSPHPAISSVQKQASQESREVGAFIKFLKKEQKPALAALLGNAYRWQCSDGQAEFFFDHSHANLIPMMSMPRNHKQLLKCLQQFFNQEMTPFFRLGTDQKQEDVRRRDAQALAEVKANPKVKFVLEKFNGTIMQCQILD